MTEARRLAPDSFTIVDGDLRIVSFCCDVVLYTHQDFSSIPESVLYVYDKYLDVCPPKTIKWYRTENMNRHKPCTPRALNMLKGWLKPGAPGRKIIHIDLKDGDLYADASEYSFWLWGNEKGELRHRVHANVIRCAFPGVWALENPSRLLDFAVDVCNHFPFESGHSGYALQTTPYKQEASETAAWRLSTKHPGLDISNPITDRVALQQETIKGVNWLTILSNRFLSTIGGVTSVRKSLKKPIEVIPVKEGLILKAGAEPRIGDVNRADILPDYRAVYGLVAPLQEPIVERYGAFDLPGGDHREKTQAWLRRFSVEYPDSASLD